MNQPKCKVARLVVAGLKGDGGKSLVSLGLIGALLDKGINVSPFKKGPDYIDTAWLGAAAKRPARNLDTYLMKPEVIRRSVALNSEGTGVAIVEGNRGLFDGTDPIGSHSTAELAKMIGAPVILIVEVTKTTRTVAALVRGCQQLDPSLNLSGIILNRVGTRRQERVIRQAIALETGIPVVGSIPKLDVQLLPSRHLGLVTTPEHPDVTRAIGEVGQIVSSYVDYNAIFDIARRESEGLEWSPEPVKPSVRKKLRVGVFRDKAFNFYYPENLEALTNRGADLVFISPLSDRKMPDVDGVYAGGGFPEIHAEELSKNGSFRRDFGKKLKNGLPVFAECGGLMYLAQSIEYEGRTHPMVGALPIDVVHMARPQGHGYVQGTVDYSNPFFEKGTKLTGHEFHYSHIKNTPGDLVSVMGLTRGEGIGNKRDGIRCGQVLAVYTHLHALTSDSWADGVMGAMTGAA